MTYGSMFLFGKDRPGASILEPESFLRAAERLLRLLSRTGLALRSRGFIEGQDGRNEAPRKATPNRALLERFGERMQSGRFMTWELFDAGWSDTRPPNAYASLTKFWEYTPSGYSAHPHHGAENCFSLAFESGTLENALEYMLSAAREISSDFEIFYGFLEENVPWARSISAPGMGDHFGELMDTRPCEITGLYDMGQSMLELAPGLFRHNILSLGHLAVAVEELRVAGLQVETFDGLVDVRVPGDPQFQRDSFIDWAPFFRLVPTAQMWRRWDLKGWQVPRDAPR